ALPEIRELLLLGNTPIPVGETLANLPRLERLWATWAAGGRRLLEVDALPTELERLGVCRHHLRDGDATRPRFSELARCSGLVHRPLDHCWPRDSSAPVGALQQLRQLRTNAPAGWSALRACRALEVVSASPRVANLRSLRTWTQLRDLTLLNAGVRGLEGF